MRAIMPLATSSSRCRRAAAPSPFSGMKKAGRRWTPELARRVLAWSVLGSSLWKVAWKASSRALTTAWSWTRGSWAWISRMVTTGRETAEGTGVAACAGREGEMRTAEDQRHAAIFKERRILISLFQDLSGPRRVTGDLPLQGLRGREFLLTPKALDELDLHPFAVKIPLETEQVGFDHGPRSFLERGPDPHVAHPAVFPAPSE